MTRNAFHSAPASFVIRCQSFSANALVFSRSPLAYYWRFSYRQYPLIRQDNMSFPIRDCCLMTGGQALPRIGTFNPLERLAFVDW